MNAKSIYKLENLPKGRTNWAAIKRLSDKDIARAAKSDPDAPLLTKRELKGFKRVHLPNKINVKAIRHKLHFSQSVFSETFGISTRTIQEWEQKRSQPRGASKALLVIIDREPQAALRALSRYS